MKRQERLRLRRRKRIETVIKAALAAVLIGGLVAGIMNFDAVKTWAGKHYVRFRIQGSVITEEENPELIQSITPSVDLSKPLNLLFVGIDRGSVKGEEGYTRSDVMILASIDAKRKRAVLVSIPRDTKVNIPGYGTEKINAAHSFNGPAGAVEAVENLSGLEINGYAEVDFEAFKNIVDAIGGVPFHLEYDILDPKVGALGKGDRVLNGAEALIICRSREFPDGDLQRIENQKAFLKAVMEKAVSIRDMQALLRILDTAVQYLSTTLEPDTIFALAEALRGMKVEDVEFATLPGDSPVPKAGQPWYYVYDQAAAAELFQNVKLYCSTMTEEEINAAKIRKEQERRLSAEGETRPQRSRIDLVVLNGARTQGLAAEVVEELEGKGYREIEVGDAAHVYADTTVYYSPGNEAAAAMVARDLMPGGGAVVEEDGYVASQYGAAVILVIGKDYAGI